MNGRALSEIEAARIHAEPVNWEPLIKENTWWSTRTGARQFVIIRVAFDFSTTTSPCKTFPTRVEFLEYKKNDPIIVTWEQFVKLANEGEMVRITG